MKKRKIEISNKTNCIIERVVVTDEEVVINIGENKPKDHKSKDMGCYYVSSGYRYNYIRKDGEELIDKNSSLVLNVHNNGNNYFLEFLSPVTPKNALLNEVLKNNITRWNADKECIEDLPNKPIVNEITPVDYCEKIEEPKKEPKIGEMCIFWDELKKYAICSILQYIDTIEPYIYETIVGYIYKNCIPFESVEQYEKFIKE